MNSMTMWSRVSAPLGGLLFAAVGAFWGSMNAGWFGLERDGRLLQPIMGIGIALVAFGFARSALACELHDAGRLGRAARYLLLAAPVLMILSGLIEFAIFGTLSLAFGLICLAVVVLRRRLFHPFDRFLVVLSAIGSLTWNTETLSAFLLVGVGLAWTILSARLLPATLSAQPSS
jgi:hypothetical protein